MRRRIRICKYVVSFNFEVVAPDEETAINKARSDIYYDPSVIEDDRGSVTIGEQEEATMYIWDTGELEALRDKLTKILE